MKESVTIIQIAKECGVSIATVSRVINHSGYVSKATRSKVEAVIEKYRYTPNAMARSLIMKQTMSIGIIIPDISNPYFSAMFRSFESAAREAGYSVVLCNTAFYSASDQRGTPSEIQYFDLMVDRKVDGVIIVGGQADLIAPGDEYCDALRRLSANIPVVVLGSQIDGIDDCLFIQRESGRGVRQAMDYLVSLGHRKIAFVGGENSVYITESRLGAYRDSLAALGISYDKSLVATSDYYAPDGYRSMKDLLSTNIDFTAFLAINDAVALGALRAIADAGLRVPEDISVISCDQFMDADYYVPRLTSINQHNEEFGRFVIGALLHVISGEENRQGFTLPPQLIVRDSCTVPKKSPK